MIAAALSCGQALRLSDRKAPVSGATELLLPSSHASSLRITRSAISDCTKWPVSGIVTRVRSLPVQSQVLLSVWESRAGSLLEPMKHELGHLRFDTGDVSS